MDLCLRQVPCSAALGGIRLALSPDTGTRPCSETLVGLRWTNLEPIRPFPRPMIGLHEDNEDDDCKVHVDADEECTSNGHRPRIYYVLG